MFNFDEQSVNQLRKSDNTISDYSYLFDDFLYGKCPALGQHSVAQTKKKCFCDLNASSGSVPEFYPCYSFLMVKLPILFHNLCFDLF